MNLKIEFRHIIKITLSLTLKMTYHKKNICKYWENKKCKYMLNSSLCGFAHGCEDIIIQECRFGKFCKRPFCIFNHKDTDFKYERLSYPKRDGMVEKLNKNMNNYNLKFYLKKIKQLEYNNFSLMDTIDKLNTKICKDGINNHIEIKKENTITNNGITTNSVEYENKKGIDVEIQVNTTKCNININKKLYKKDKLENLYKKWINVYNVYQKYNFNYKNIKENINEIFIYLKDKNIYKIKERCVKIYNYYNKIILGETKEYLPISKILKL
jgi:hypothetical protein